MNRAPKWDIVLGKELWDAYDLTVKEIAAVLSTPQHEVRVSAIKSYAYTHHWKRRKDYTVRTPLTYEDVMRESNKLYNKRCPNCKGHYQGRAGDDTPHCHSTAFRSIYSLAA